MPPGRHGAYLRIDLTRGTAVSVPIPDAVAHDFLGGVGLGTWILREEGGAQADPLSPDAPLVFALSPFVGTPLTTSAKFAVCARSPLTGFLSDAISSSHFAIAAKQAGFDAYVLVGRADEWTRVVVDNGEISLESAADLCGKPAHACERDGFRTAAIGVAGENLVRYATISNDGRHAGRGGLGTVMGSKRVKAFSVRGSKRVPVADPRGVVAAARALSEASLGPATAKYRELGTIANVLAFNRLNTLPTRNFQDGTFDAAPSISAEALHEMDRVGRTSCAACTIGCEHVFAAPSGKNVRLEYESLFALGSLLGIDDRGAVLEAARLCDDLGIDTISVGGTLAFAMESDRFDLEFGQGGQVLTWIEDIAHRRGAGDALAEGSRRAAAAVGQPELAMHVKGLEMPGYDPRALQATALGLAVATRGADHNRSGAYELDFSSESDRLDYRPEDAKKVIAIEDRNAVIDSLILCKFLRGVFGDFGAEAGELYRLVTGRSIDLLAAGARICALRRVFNEEAGWRREDDDLPERFLKGALSRTKLADMIAHYYKARCWTPQGKVPSRLQRQLRLSR